MKRSIYIIGGISLLMLGLTGCVSGLQGDTYSRSEARQVQEVEFGTILSTNPVVIEGRQSDMGQLPGAIIGGVAGSSVGEGKGQEIFTILGAVGGAVVGSIIEEQVTRAQGRILVSLGYGKDNIFTHQFEKGTRPPCLPGLRQFWVACLGCGLG